MNRLRTLFKTGKKDLLNIFFTAGYPHFEDTKDIILALDKAGVDMIEIGMPYSDPVADGPTIQAANQVSLAQGMSVPKLIQQLEGIRELTNIPIILMGHLNPIIQYGVKRFAEDAQRVGVDALILPDLPVDHSDEYLPTFKEHDLSLIQLISPQTSEERLAYIDSISDSFIYAVSSFGTTGAKSAGFDQYQIDYLDRLKHSEIKTPIMVGFGISGSQTFNTVCEYASGAIVGSAFVKALATMDNLEADINSFISSLRN